MSRPGQLAFAFPPSVSYAEADFVPGACSAEARGWLARWPDWPSGRLGLWGPQGAGKSHLAAIWAARSGATVVPGAALARAEAPALLGAARHAAIEDADPAAGDADAERTLFHLLNLIAEAGGTALLTGRAAPARWPVVLPDLRSRLAASGAVAIAAPDEAVLAAVLAKALADRQLAVEPELIVYLVPRLPRTFAAMQQAAEALDRASLATGRRITRALAARVIPPHDNPES